MCFHWLIDYLLWLNTNMNALKATSHEKMILAKYVQNVTLINNMLISCNKNITLKYLEEKYIAPA